ncbi:zinc finger, C2H2 type [Opisthorchis viverrini]|uniref:Zinc finger, C2H2 type n=1 Tax=Opisthorchis viverrini TaxID=6198 RepID=A0A1S8WPF0_OPIVI|nr:zinc finger, C2H2 type [Opisthorchis viverrini]
MPCGEICVRQHGNNTDVLGAILPDVLSSPQEYPQHSTLSATHLDTSTNLDRGWGITSSPSAETHSNSFPNRQTTAGYTWTRTFRCRLCTESYEVLRDLRQHMRTAHTGQSEIHTGKSVEESQQPVNKGRHCPECGKFFSRCDNLLVHWKAIHGEQEQHMCEECGYVFNRKANYVRHIRRMHRKGDQTNCQQRTQSPSTSLELQSDLSTTHKSDHE